MRKISYLTDGRRRTSILVLRPEYVFDRPAVVERSADVFERLWRDGEARFNKPRLLFTGMEWTVAGRLIKRYPLDRLRQCMLFWYRTSDPNPNLNPLINFAHCLPLIDKDLA